MQNKAELFLEELVNQELGGFEAQKIYAPPYRALLSDEEILARNPKYAAVNIMLYQKNNDWFFPLILRTHNEKDRHSGQISLPGGKKEKNDADFAETAIRETSEEIGIQISEMKILKELSPIYIPPSNFFVYPFISFIENLPNFRLEIGEVQEIIEFPLAKIKSLLSPPKIMKLPKSNGYKVPFIEFENYKIWGATSMILSELNFLLKNV